MGVVSTQSTFFFFFFFFSQHTMDKCPRCDKRVYFAERRLYKGQYYHQLCSNKQQDDDMAGKKHFALHEDMYCNPQDRPVNASNLGVPASPLPAKHRTCPSCAFQLNNDCRFCPNCGTKVPEPQEETLKDQPDPRTFCSCGSRFPEDARFCTSCGSSRPQ